jgi:predicted ATPase
MADVPGFTGREAELVLLDTVLDDGTGSTAGGTAAETKPAGPRIAVVSGTAGVGKTALAMHWAHNAASRFPGGQLYVNLRGFDPGGQVMDPAEAVRGFLAALGVPPQQIPADLDARSALYRSLIAGKRMMIVADNARDAQQVRPLLPGTPTAVALVTSRDQLTGLVAVDGAHPLTVAPLSAAMDALFPAEKHHRPDLIAASLTGW